MLRSLGTGFKTMAYTPDLPNEIWMEIFSFAIVEEYPTLKALERVSKRCEALVEVSRRIYFRQNLKCTFYTVRCIHPVLALYRYRTSKDILVQSGLVKLQNSWRNPVLEESAVVPPTKELYFWITSRKAVLLEIVTKDDFVTVFDVLDSFNKAVQNSLVRSRLKTDWVHPVLTSAPDISFQQAVVEENEPSIFNVVTIGISDVQDSESKTKVTALYGEVPSEPRTP